MAKDGAERSYFETPTGNRISRRSTLCGTQNIRIHGKSTIEDGAVIRGDLAGVRMGKYCTVSRGCVLRPAYKLVKGSMVFFSLSIGDHVFIDRDCVVEASAVGSGVIIGRGCVVSKRCVIKDCVHLRPGTVLPPDTVVAPFSVYAGCPGQLVAELPECAPAMIRAIVHARYGEAPPS